MGHVWNGHMECLRNSEKTSAAAAGKWGDLKEVKLGKAPFYSEIDGVSVKGFEQKYDVISLGF